MKAICFLFDPNVGGTAMRAKAVYERLRAEGHEVRFAIPDEAGTTIEFLEAAGLAVDRLPIPRPANPSRPRVFLGYWVRFPRSISRIAAYLRTQKPDVIHVNGAFDIGPALAGRMSGLPVVWHLNDTVFGPRLSHALGRVVRRLATVIVTAADRVAQHYSVVTPRTMTIHAPVDVERFAARAPAGRPGREPVIGLLGNWNWIKGQDRFVDLIALLRQDGRPVRGRVFGRFLETQRGFWEPIMARVERDGLAEAVETPGFASDPAGAIAGMDVLVLTSHSEASPMCVLEAMAVGVPQVVFDVGGVHEMLGDGPDAPGVIVPQGDVEAMARAVARLLDDPDLYARMALAGQERARRLFSLETCVARHHEAYRSAMARRAGGSRG